MLCSVCKKKRAEKTFEKTTDGGGTREYYCLACYRRLFCGDAAETTGFFVEKGGENATVTKKVFPPHGAKNGENKSRLYAGKDTHGENKSARCRFCGTTAEDYYRSGLLGCPECYKYLFFAVEKNLRAMQGGDPHAGKRPPTAHGKEAENTYEKNV